MEAAAEPQAIVVIDDDHAMRLSCRKILAKSGFAVETFENGAQGLEGVARLHPPLVVVDLKMPGISGMDVIARVHEIDPHIVIVVITGYATIDTAIEAMKCGAYDFLPKPFSPDELRLIVNRGLERRRLALASARAEMERELLKRRFITFVSHQLQTPLVAIHQYLDVLRRLGETPEAAARRQEWLGRCLKRTEELQAVIRDWLTLASLEKDTLARRRVRVDLAALIPHLLASYEAMAAADGITLDARLGECAASGDPTCLTVLFDNLITNAIKYNRPGGKVTVTSESGPGEVVISVSDTGLGIPEHYRQLLFHEFFRAPQAAGKASGSGLGLAISKRIVSEMGGSIEVQSQPEVGSTFRVRLLAWCEPSENHEERHVTSAADNPDRR